MGWTQNVSRVYNWGLQQLVNSIASVLNTTAHVLTLTGGAGLAFAQDWNKTLAAGYYGQVNADGALELDAQVVDTGINLNYNLPLQVNTQREGQWQQNFRQYAHPEVIFYMSGCLIGGSFLLKTGANWLHQWQQYREDLARYQIQPEHFFAPPSSKEYGCGVISALSTTLSFSASSYLFTSFVLQELIKTPAAEYGYPNSGETSINSTYYQGPVATNTFPFSFKLDPDEFKMQLPYLGNTTVLVQMTVKGLAHVTYGGAFYLLENAQPALPIALTRAMGGIIGASSYLLKNSLFRKAVEHRDQRLLELNQYEPMALNP